ncbi:MAG: ABC transporter permease [Sediminibacterium sp.]
MFKNYLRTALRSLFKNRFYTAINIFSLTVGLSCCVLITLYIAHETSYDKFHSKGNRIARVIMEYSFGGSVTTGNFTSTKVLPAFKKQFPQIEEGVRMIQYERVISYEDKLFSEKKVMFADSTFFDLFDFKMAQGNPKAALSGLNKIILTKTAAYKYFTNTDPVGKILYVGSNRIPYEVTGIMEDIPSNSQMRFDMLASFSSLEANQDRTYWNANYTTYLLMRSPDDIKTVEAKIPGFIKEEMKDQGSVYLTYFLEPLFNIHLLSPYDSFEPNNNIQYIYIITGVALLILLIACFTYINLNTARSLERAKEVGIRKTVGASFKQIFVQFMGESVILTVIATLLTVVIVWLVLPLFNQLTDKEIPLSLFYSKTILLALLGSMLVIIFLSGSYPALVVSRFQPIKVLKGSFARSGSGNTLRRSLTVFQFGISLFLLVSTFIIQKQLHYIRSKNMGYTREQVLMLPSDSKITATINSFKSELKKVPGVMYVSRAQNAPHNIIGGYNMRSAQMPSNAQLNVKANPIDEEYIPATGIEILYGSNFTEKDIASVEQYTFDMDPSLKNFPFIINETAAKQLGFDPAKAVGKKMFLDDTRPGYVKAVIKDFHFQSIHNPIGPLVLFPSQWSSVILVKTAKGDISNMLSGIEKQWKSMAPHRPFQFKFLDDEFNKMYTSELRLGKVFNIFTGISILLAIIGLLGLCSYAAQQRIKEIGIRKIMGAGITDIIKLMSGDFIKLSLISMLIAFPLAFISINKWLQSFAYRINIEWWLFLLAAIIGLSLVLLTTGILAARAASINPVKNLRTE